MAMRTKEQSSKCCPPDQGGDDKLNPLAESGFGEIVLYQPEGDVRLKVRVENDTVWLNRQQLAILFNRDIKTIGKHISNTLKEECHNSVVAKFATTAEDGKTYQVEHYDLDIILSVGYRVKSANGVRFRRWANQVLKDYMLKGYAVNQRMVATGMQIANQFQEQRQLIENQGAKLENVDARLSTVEKKTMRTIHDRFLLVDDIVYHFGASFKDMGNEMTAFSILNFVTPEEVITKIQESMKGK